MRITVDGTEIEVPPGELLIKAAQDNGTYIPRFCWHPRMKPVGMCRMCLVEVETPRGRQLTTSCTTPVADGIVVDTQSEVVKKAQEGVLEFLLLNHPLDCPVCDKGGECPLQDQAFAYGPGESRFVEEKRHFAKPIVISDLVLLDRERCILCARCTRFSDEVSGDPLIEFKERGNVVEVNTFPDEPFASYFSGNTVQICPVGALTAAPYRFKARPWDLEAIESVSLVDSVHSKVAIQSTQNEVVRIIGVDNEPTNQGWLSDKDRFIYESLTAESRVTTPLLKTADGFREAAWVEALSVVADRLGGVLGTEVAGIGGARSTNEEAFAFGKFLRTVVVTPHIDAQLGDGLDADFAACVTPRATIPDIDTAGTVLLWGADPKEEFPVLYLRLRRAARELGVKLVIAHPRRTGLDDVAAHKITYRPGEGPDVLRKLVAAEDDYADAAAALGDGPVIALVGRTGLAEDPGLAEAVAAHAEAHYDARILPLIRRGNVFGALDMGLAPTLLPGRVSVTDESGRTALEDHWGPLPSGLGKDTPGILRALADGDLKALLLLGADPARDCPDPVLAAQALAAADFVVAFDTFITDSSRHADVILPAATYSEVEGTVTNLEGRVQKVNALVPPAGQARPVWSTLDDLARMMGGELVAPSAEAVAKEIAEVAPAYQGISWDLLDWGAGRSGAVVPLAEGSQPLEHIPVDPGVRVVSSRMTLHTSRVLFDDGVQVRHSPALAALAPEPRAYLNPRDAALLAVSDGDIVSIEGIDRIELPVVLDSTLAPRTVYVPFNLAGTASLGAAPTVSVDAVRSESS